MAETMPFLPRHFSWEWFESNHLSSVAAVACRAAAHLHLSIGRRTLHEFRGFQRLRRCRKVPWP